MILPGVPPVFVYPEELEVGESYHIPSGMGGVWVLKYVGMNDEGKYLFDFEADPHKLQLRLPAVRVVQQVSIRQDKFDTIEDWRAAGGRWPKEYARLSTQDKLKRKGYTFVATHRNYSVKFRGEHVHGAGILPDAKGPTGRAATIQRRDNYKSAIAAALRHSRLPND